MEKKIFLSEKDMPRAWYNIQADLPNPLPPPLNPATGEPITPDMLAAIFPMNLIEQEVSTERWIDIPEEVLERLLMWRPTPLCQGLFAGEVSRNTCPHLLQERGREPCGEPQTEYGHCPGILQQDGGD